jgi:uncharacterized protein Yka (UPF0111/DUF47 family)
MKAPRWLLPETPDIVGLLRAQLALTRTGIRGFVAWADGDASRADEVRRVEHQADAAKRALQRALRGALVTPLEPEDVFSLSQGIDWVLNEAKDVIGESEVMNCPPDAALATMAAAIATALEHLDAGIAALAGDPDAATASAEAAIKEERHLEHAYRAAMAALFAEDDLRSVIARRELYRRCSRMGTTVVEIAERVVYATFKLG